MNHLYRIFFVVLGLFSYSMRAHRLVKNYNEFQTQVLKPKRGNVVHLTIDDIDPRTNFSGALPVLNDISKQPRFAGVGFFSVNINNTPEVLIWLSQKNHHIGEWPAFAFIEDGEVKTIKTGIHGDSLAENIAAGINKHFSRRIAPAAQQSSMPSQQPSRKNRRRRRSSNGRSRTPNK